MTTPVTEIEVVNNGGDILVLLHELEKAIEEHKTLVVCVASDLFECRNTVHIQNYEFNEHIAYFDMDHMELHLNFDEVKIEHNFNCFSLMKDDGTEVCIEIL